MARRRNRAPGQVLRSSGRVYTVLRASSAVLFLAGYLALATVDGYGPIMLIPPVILLALAPIGEYLDKRTPNYRVLSRAAVIVYLFFIPMTVIVLDLMNAVLLLNMFIQAYTLLHQKQERNYHHLYLMSFFLLLAACVQAPGPAIGPVLLLFLVSAIWAFLSLRLQVESVQEQATAVPDIIPLDRANSRPTDSAAEPFNFSLLTTITVLSGMAVLLTVAIFLLTPRIEAGLIGRSAGQIEETGISETVDLLGGTTITENDTPVMHVSFPEEPGRQFGREDMLYWRVTTLPYFSRNSWGRATLHNHYEPIDHERPFFDESGRRELDTLTRERAANTRIVRQQIYMDAVPKQGLPCLDLVQHIEAEFTSRHMRLAWDKGLDFTARLESRSERRMTYLVDSEIQITTTGGLRTAAPDYSFMGRDDLRLLTHEELLPETVRLAEGLTRDRDSVYDKAIAVQRYLSGPDYLYSLDLPPIPEDFAIDTFINVAKIGHCEFYASALALMLRSQGIPTRVVSGYRGGEWDETDQAYTVRERDAHLWVEVLIPGHGWVVFDPSPRSDVDPSAIGVLAHAFDKSMLKLRMLWYQEVVGFEGALRLGNLRDRARAVLQGDGNGDGGDTAAPEAAGRTTPALMAALLCAALAIAVFLLRSRRRHTQSLHGLTPDQRRAVRLFRQVRRVLQRNGAAWHGQTAEELALRLSNAGLHPREHGLSALETYNAVRFGGRELPETRFRELLRQVNALRARKPS